MGEHTSWRERKKATGEHSTVQPIEPSNAGIFSTTVLTNISTRLVDSQTVGTGRKELSSRRVHHLAGESPFFADALDPGPAQDSHAAEHAFSGLDSLGALEWYIFLDKDLQGLVKGLFRGRRRGAIDDRQGRRNEATADLHGQRVVGHCGGRRKSLVLISVIESSLLSVMLIALKEARKGFALLPLRDGLCLCLPLAGFRGLPSQSIPYC